MERIGAVTGATGATLDQVARAKAPAAAADQAGASFADFVADLANEVSRSVASAEKVSEAGIKGNLPINQVVDEVLQAERSLQAAVAVRDKVVAAYLELSRMQI